MSKYPTRLWSVRASGFEQGPRTEQVIATSRGRALAAAWRCDAFEGLKFGEFLRSASCRRAEMPEWWCAPITVNGEPAFFLGRNLATVQFCRADGAMRAAHPSEVLPEQYRPAGYRTTPAAPVGEVLRRVYAHLRKTEMDDGGTAEGAQLMVELVEHIG